jgi:hypothetical protein
MKYGEKRLERAGVELPPNEKDMGTKWANAIMSKEE